MKTLIQKINVLQWTSRMEDSEFKKEGDSGFDPYVRKTETLDAIFEDLRKQAIEEESVVGRRVSFQVMDSHAHYVITHLLKNNKVAVQWICYDESYIDDRLGERGVLELDFVLEKLEWEDSLRAV